MTFAENKNKTLLIVDDEADLRSLLLEEFSSLGFNTMGAENGVKALEMIRNHKVDAVLSDVRMPGGDGLTLLKEVVAHTPKIPVVLVTGYADITREQVIEFGGVDLITKPFNIQDLVNKISVLLQSV